MFYDLNIRIDNPTVLDSSVDVIIERLFKYGYRGVAFTTEVDESLFDKSKKEKEGKKKNNSEPNTIVPPPPDLTKLRTQNPKIKFFNRINIIVSESANIRKFTQCKNIKKYDLISFQPESQNALKTLTGIADIDIVSYNPQNRYSLSLNRKLYNQFVNQNVYFELAYAPAIVDSTSRRNLLSLAHSYRAIGKSKNIIVCSGAQTSAQYVRGPYDVMNFALLFGLSEEQCKSSISRNCEKLLLRARKQRRHKATIEMTQNVGDNDNSGFIRLEDEQQNE